MWWDMSQLNTTTAETDKMAIYTTKEVRMDYIAPNSAIDPFALF
jgi:hypothetical protein